jgi:hypothetical protein
MTHKTTKPLDAKQDKKQPLQLYSPRFIIHPGSTFLSFWGMNDGQQTWRLE